MGVIVIVTQRDESLQRKISNLNIPTVHFMTKFQRAYVDTSIMLNPVRSVQTLILLRGLS